MQVSDLFFIDLRAFPAAARELGTDNDEDRFNEKLKKLAKQKPEEKKASD